MKLAPMLRESTLQTALFAAVPAWSPASATSEHDYAVDEYVVIDGGMAPNGRMSLASHGEGDGGRERFHVYLMAEPAHRRIAALDDISSEHILDSWPAAFNAGGNRYRIVDLKPGNSED
jgi:hypothetical protein